jgi:hypothetical protein
MRQIIPGARNARTFLGFLTMFLIGLTFTLVGFSAYFQIKLLPFTSTEKISFFPQGFVMVFYGSLFLTLSLYLALTIYWNIGSGYNEFSPFDGDIRIYRVGFPGKYREIFLTYKFDFVRCLILSRDIGLNPRVNISLYLEDKRRIPLFPVSNQLTLKEAEDMAFTLSSHLGVELIKETNS